MHAYRSGQLQQALQIIKLKTNNNKRCAPSENNNTELATRPAVKLQNGNIKADSIPTPAHQLMHNMCKIILMHKVVNSHQKKIPV